MPFEQSHPGGKRFSRDMKRHTAVARHAALLLRLAESLQNRPGTAIPWRFSEPPRFSATKRWVTDHYAAEFHVTGSCTLW